MGAIECVECGRDEFEIRYWSPSANDERRFNGLRCRGCGQIYGWTGTYIIAERGKRVMTSLDNKYL